MNKLITAGSTIDESLRTSLNSPTIVKLGNGRVISGILIAIDGIYHIKLGVKYIPLDVATLRSVSSF